MTFLVIGVVAFAVSALTLFSGFGLGTLLMPAFALFFPIDVAVAATAVVHVLNSLFKVGLLYREARREVILRFGLPAIAASFVGALLLGALAGREPLLRYELALGAEPRVAEITPIRLVLGGLILAFAILDLWPSLKSWRVDPRWLPLGGVVSGFFGGLSGHQGALRAAFLLPLGLPPSAFAGTQAVLACLVDFARIAVYGVGFLSGKMAGVSGREQWSLVAVAALCAFGGALLGKRLLPKMTIGGLRWLTGSLLLVVGLGLASGVL